MLGRRFDGWRASRRGSPVTAPLFVRAALHATTAGLSAVIVIIAGCGGDDASPPAPGDGGLDPSEKCLPQLPAGWAPRWRPPRAPMTDACSDDQIQREYAACEGPMATSTTCAPFRNDPVNANCIACIFSSEADPSYSAIVRVGSSWKTNTGGCIALVDGDKSTNGCGARVQAASACYDAACDGCEPFTSYLQCREQAPSTVCRPYYLDAVCLLRPIYSSCTAYAVNEDFFTAVARLFCGPVKRAAQGRARDAAHHATQAFGAATDEEDRVRQANVPASEGDP